ncbi:IS3 family transposase [Deinococcus alpinitundrae]|uniref:IS3 family transposase n=1 Tax=Deinococcus alpinitundrae TaxID=468913 RepID=UPI0034D2425F
MVLKWSGYGDRRVTHELARRGRPANHKRVLRVMRERRLILLRCRGGGVQSDGQWRLT